MNRNTPEFFVFSDPEKRIPNTPEERKRAWETIEGYVGLLGMRRRVSIEVTRKSLTGNLVVIRTEQGNAQSYEIFPPDDPRMLDRPGIIPLAEEVQRILSPRNSSLRRWDPVHLYRMGGPRRPRR